MTNKELERLLRVGILLAGLILGLAVGGFITSLDTTARSGPIRLSLKSRLLRLSRMSG